MRLGNTFVLLHLKRKNPENKFVDTLAVDFLDPRE
jgi:hypothetical protein